MQLLSGRALATQLLGFSVGMKLIQSVWSVLLGAIAILLIARTLRWRRLINQPHPSDHPR